MYSGDAIDLQKDFEFSIEDDVERRLILEKTPCSNLEFFRYPQGNYR